jgi:hypothetical protein
MGNYDLHRAIAVAQDRAWTDTESQALLSGPSIRCPGCNVTYSFWHDKHETEQGKLRHVKAFSEALGNDHPQHLRELLEDGHPNRITHDSSKWTGGPS